MGRLNPNLSFFGGDWDAVVILVEGCGSLVGGRGHLGVENRGGVSFIRAEAATEAMVVSMDSSSKSSRSNESTRETSFVASATVLKETSLMGVAAPGSFVGVGALGLLSFFWSFFGGDWDAVVILVEGCGSLVGGRGHLGVENRGGVSFIRAEAATEAMVVSMDSSSKSSRSMDSSSKSSRSNESTRETSFVASATVLKETSLMGVAAPGSFVGVGALGLLLK